LIVILLLLTLLKRWFSGRKKQNQVQYAPAPAYSPGVAPQQMYSAVPAPYQSPVQEYKGPNVQGGYMGTPPPQPGYIEAPQRWDGRAELSQ